MLVEFWNCGVVQRNSRSSNNMMTKMNDSDGKNNCTDNML